MAEIRRVRAIDNHSHPPKLVSQGEKDDEFDALPCDPLEPTAASLTTRPENPQYLAAWRDLWGYKYDDRAPAHVQEVVAAKARARAAQGDRYPAWVLGRIGLDVEPSNRVAMGRGLNDAHHRWALRRRAHIPARQYALAADAGSKFFSRAKTCPRDMQRRRVSPVASHAWEYRASSRQRSRRRKGQGAVAIKFEVAHLRSLDFCRRERGRGGGRLRLLCARRRPGHGAVPAPAGLSVPLRRRRGGAARSPGAYSHWRGCGATSISGANPVLLGRYSTTPGCGR
jgi:hypothetical protein